MKVLNNANLYLTERGQCAYLPDNISRHLIVEPDKLLNYDIYNTMINRGFRRSGTNLYRPWCDHCRGCVSVRVDVKQFATKRSQRRTQAKNKHLRIKRLPPILHQEHFDLFKKYLSVRHPDDNMNQMNEAEYMEFLTCQWAQSSFFSFYDGDKLLCVSAVDQLKQGLSATYTFFDPDYSSNSLGVFSILSLIDLCKSLKLDYLYLGFFISNCEKMNYKQQYQPLEYYYDDMGWIQQK